VGEFAPDTLIDATPEVAPASIDMQSDASGETTLSELMRSRMKAGLGERYSDHSTKIAEVRQELEVQYGGRQFSYEHASGVVYTGTMAQIVDDCPHAKATAIREGAEGVVALLAPYEKVETPEDETPEDDAETETDEDTDPFGLAVVAKETNTPISVVTEKVPVISKKDVVVESEPIKNPVELAAQPKTDVIDIAVPIAATEITSPATVETKAEVIVPVEAAKNNVETVVDTPASIEAPYFEAVSDRAESLPDLEIIAPLEKSEEPQMQEAAIEAALSFALSLYEDETEPEYQSEVPNVIEDVMEHEIEVEEASGAEIIPLFDQPEYEEFVELIFNDDDEPIESYTELFDIVQDEPMLPVELVLAHMIDAPLTDIFEKASEQTSQDAVVELQPDRAYTKETFMRAIIRLRVELAYVDIDEEMTFEQLPDSLKTQLLDLLYRLGYDDALSAMQDLMQRHGLEYLLYFISQVGVNMERTAKQHMTVTARKKKQHEPSLYTETYAKIAQFVIVSLHRSPQSLAA